jgi:predicted ester cyclase
MISNLDKFKAIDDAYNSRNWEAYTALLDETFRGWMMGDAKPQDKAQHVRAAKDFCTVSADNCVHNSPYFVAFADGDWTCTIARFTGSMTGPVESIQPTHRTFETTFATISRWVGGKIVEEHEFLDASAILRQVVGDTHGKETL